MAEQEKTTWVEFTQPTLNYAKGDIVALTDEQLEVVDAVVKKRFGKVEGDGGRNRYKKTTAPSERKATRVSTAPTGSTRRQTAGGRQADTAGENDTKAKAKAADKNVGDDAGQLGDDTPPAAGAGANS